MFGKKFVILLAITSVVISCNQAPADDGHGASADSAGTVVLPDMHNAQNALDVAGNYKGVLPCADCEGIETSITLNDDSTYHKTSKYLGKNGNELSENGQWHFLADGNTIALNSGENDVTKWKVGENTLTMLDRERKAIAGPLAAHYILQKQ